MGDNNVTEIANAELGIREELLDSGFEDEDSDEITEDCGSSKCKTSVTLGKAPATSLYVDNREEDELTIGSHFAFENCAKRTVIETRG